MDLYEKLRNEYDINPIQDIREIESGMSSNADRLSRLETIIRLPAN